MTTNMSDKAKSSSFFSAEHEQFRTTVQRFIANEITPYHYEWENQGKVPRDIWRKAGGVGMLLTNVPEAYGGAGGDFLYTVVVLEEIAKSLASGVTGFTTHSDIVAQYLLNFGTEEQKQENLPGMATGDIVSSIAMTEPGAGSDVKAIRTTAIRSTHGYVINGQKTFITNGYHADRVLIVAKTTPDVGAHGISLFWVDTKTDGFKRGRLLDKVGQKAQDTCELFFDNMEVSADALLGQENKGFGYLMKELVRERLMIAIRCTAALEAALDWTISYTKERRAFDRSIFDNQYIRFKLADIKTLAAATRAFTDSCIQQYLRGELSADGAAMAKLWASEATGAIDQLLQFHGGYGYMREYAIGRAFTDVRPNRIYGGSSEIMRELIARAL